jgi:hypothetical protein
MPNCGTEDDGIAPIVWREPKGNFVDILKKNGEYDFVYCAGKKKPEIVPSWKCCICGQEFYSKKRYPLRDDNMFCLWIYKDGGPLGSPSIARVAYNVKTHDIKLFYYFRKNEREVYATPKIKEIITYENIETLTTMRLDSRLIRTVHIPYWILYLWQGKSKFFPVVREYFPKNPLLEILIGALIEDYDK